MTEASLHASVGSKKNKNNNNKNTKKEYSFHVSTHLTSEFSFSCFHGATTIHRSRPDNLCSTQEPVISIIEKINEEEGKGRRMGRSDHERKERGIIEEANECHHLIWGGRGRR